MTEPRTPYRPHPAAAEADRLAVLAQRLREAVARDIRPRPDIRPELTKIIADLVDIADGVYFVGFDFASNGHALEAAHRLDEAALALKQLAAESH